MERFILLAHPRCGSALLALTLAAHANIRMFGELFNDEEEERELAFSEIPRWRATRLLGIDKSMYYRVGEDGGAFLHERVFCERYFEESIKSVGFKIFYEQARENLNVKKAWEYLLANAGIKVIHLTRLNLLETYLSLRVATLTNEWARPKGIPLSRNSEPQPIRLEAKECALYFDEIVAYGQWVKSYWRDHPILELNYENDVRTHYDSTVSRIEDFLQVDHCPVEKRLEKQARCHPREEISNYDELKEYFRYTIHEKYFV
jgi:LPS sulfotransferase NodH